MAEEPQQERTEQPTPKRLEEARKKGDVPRSRELTMTGVMLCGAAAILLLSGPSSRRILDAFSGAFEFDRATAFDTASLTQRFGAIAGEMFAALLPLAVVLLAAVFLSAALIGGWSFSLEALKFKMDRLSPVKGLKRVFGANGLNELIKAMAKFALVAIIAVSWLWFSVEDLIGLGRQPIGPAVSRAFELSAISLLIVGSGLVVIAAVDVPFQLWQYQKKLRMTRQQVRDEMKETEGRPEVKSRIRALQKQAAMQRMMEEVPDADVVITNPTHFAVALKYDDETMGAPRVVAKGRDQLAARIREVAELNKVPLFSAPPLARALYKSAEVGDEIPARLYTAVAQVLAYVYQLKETLRPGQRPMQPPVPIVDEDDF
ncbi:MAG: flagellar biosynthesis protein FlhB [Woeseiaceae bacterium]|nr:flagellar biosynthesis protein FlhB [Woeseiaceae bacterium]